MTDCQWSFGSTIALVPPGPGLVKIAPNKQPDLIPHKNKPVPIQGICHLVENIRFKKMWNFGLPPWSKQVQTFELFLTKQQYLSELLTDAHHAESTHLGASAEKESA